MIENQASKGYVKLTPREVYRVNRIRIARDIGINPADVDTWSPRDYHDYLAVTNADSILAKLK